MPLLNSAYHTKQIRTKLLEYIERYMGTEYDQQLIMADAIAFSNLHPLQRSSYGTSYDHSVRVTNCIVYEFKVATPNNFVIALLHDIIEDGNVNIVDLEQLFGIEISNSIQILTRKPSALSGIESDLERIKENLELLDHSEDIRLVKCADRLDNLRDMLQIPPDTKLYPKIPKWVAETKLSILPLAEITNSIALKKIEKEVESVEKFFSQEVKDQIIRLKEAMRADGMRVSNRYTS